MKKKIKVLCAVLIAMAILFSLTGCELGLDVEEVTEDTTPVIEDVLPVTEEEIVKYVNDVVNYVSTDANFNGDAPEVNISEDFGVDDVKCVAIGGSETPDNLKTIQDASKTLKNTILSSLPKDEMKPNNGETVEYGKGGIGKVIYPLTSDTLNLTVEDVELAECRLEGEMYYIDLYLSNNEASIIKALEIADKTAVLADFDSAKEYVTVNDYSSAFISRDTRALYNEENPDDIECCRIHLETNSVTNKIDNISFVKSAYVTADVTGVNTFDSLGNFNVLFRFNDTTTYSFIWVAPTAE